MSAAPSLATYGQDLVREWRGMVAALVGWMLLAVLFLLVAPPQYSVDMQVAPAEGNADRQPAEALGEYVGLLGIDIGANDRVTPYALYRAVLTSEVVMGRLVDPDRFLHRIFANEWDGTNWHPPGGVAAIGRQLRALVGHGDWRPPDGQRLAEWLTRRVRVQPTRTQGLYRIELTLSDPTLAAELLVAVHTAADQFVRDRALRRAELSADHLRQALATALNNEHRAMLAELLVQQQATVMLGSTSLPYAAEILSGPTVPLQPNAPSVTGVLGVALAFGIISALAWGLRRHLRAALGRPRPSSPVPAAAPAPLPAVESGG